MLLKITKKASSNFPSSSTVAFSQICHAEFLYFGRTFIFFVVVILEVIRNCHCVQFVPCVTMLITVAQGTGLALLKRVF